MLPILEVEVLALGHDAVPASLYVRQQLRRQRVFAVQRVPFLLFRVAHAGGPPPRLDIGQ